MLKVAKIPRQIGQAVKEKRHEMGLTQSQLAESSNTSRSLVYRLEKGISNDMSLDKLYSILGALGLGLAVFDEASKPEGIESVHVGDNADRGGKGHAGKPLVSGSSSRGMPKGNSSRNTGIQYERELKAAGNIKGFKAIRSQEG